MRIIVALLSLILNCSSYGVLVVPFRDHMKELRITTEQTENVACVIGITYFLAFILASSVS